MYKLRSNVLLRDKGKAKAQKNKISLLLYLEIFQEVILFMAAQNHTLAAALLQVCFLGEDRYSLTE